MARPFLKIGVIIAFPQADGVFPTDMKDTKMIESGRASALEMFEVIYNYLFSFRFTISFNYAMKNYNLDILRPS